ncbi:MAG TPA: R3H domain-containing nucleic acid-binding protein [Thermoanaerobaculia bacterium]|jgi:stage III sporulation protein SpoIIIAA|nr:R3H domain-containing nucleic acid-binding protein [Thermoanaerobaculia bacterium]
MTDDLELLLAVMPPAVRAKIEPHPRRGELVELVLDLGRLPEARFPDSGEFLSEEPVSREDIDYVVQRIGRFGKDNRAGIARTLHRISAIRNRVGDVIGLTCRVGRAVYGTVDILRDVIEAGESILLLGRPGVGKTTILREAARVLADDLSKRVIVVDTSNEIAGDGDVPHPGIGRARRMQVPSPEEQHAVMIEAVENHMPQVIVIDEIGTTAEALAARTIAERGVQLIATAHGNTLENLLQNPTLSDLVGGIQAVTLSDEEARRRGTQKTVLERKAPPTFGVLIEIQDKDRLAVHHDVAEVVDRLLRDVPPRPELRTRREGGEVEIRKAERAEQPDRSEGSDRSERGPARRASKKAARAATPWFAAPVSEQGEETEEAPAPPPKAARGKPLRIFPYAVSKSKLERALRKFRVSAYIVDDLDDADMVVTLKAQERRQPRRLRDAHARGIPFYVVRSNTIVQMENFLSTVFGVNDPTAGDEEALREVEEAIDQALEQGNPVELSPQNNHLRRLQHQIIERYGLTSQSKGEEPYRRVVIYPG